MKRRILVLAALAALALGAPAGADTQCFARIAPGPPSGTGVTDNSVAGVCANLVPLPVALVSISSLQTGCGIDYDIAEKGPDGECGIVELPRCEYDVCGHGTSSGSAALACQIAYGSPCMIYTGQSLWMLQGTHSSAVRDGIGARFDHDYDQRTGICYQDYTGNGARVVVVPLTTVPGGGRSMVTVQGYAAFFIKDRPDNGSRTTVRAEFIAHIVPGH